MYSAERSRGTWLFVIGLLALSQAPGAQAGDFVIGLGAEADTDDGMAVAALADFALADDTWAGFSVSHAQVEGAAALDDTRYADVELDHFFGPLGVRLGAAYWGDPNVLDSVDVRASLYARTDAYTLAVDYEHRAFDLTIGGGIVPARSVGFDADGLGINVRLELTERFEIYGGGMSYDYSRDVRLQRDVDALRLLSRSRLALMNSLIDYRWQAGIETAFGLKLLDLRVGRWQSAVDGEQVDTLGAGFLMPLGRRADVEFRLSFDDSESFGHSTVFSVFLYFFGGR